MKPSLRECLGKSNAAAVAIAMLLLWSLDNAFRALWQPLVQVASFVGMAVAIWGIPYRAKGLQIEEQFALISAGIYLHGAIAGFLWAWLLARWVYCGGRSRL